MGNAQREQYAALLRRTDTIPVVDESHVALCLDGRPDAATVRHVLPRHDHVGEREQEPLGRPADGVDPLPRSRWSSAWWPPAWRSTSVRPSTSSWSPHGCSSTARSSGQRTAPGCACSATPSSRRSRSELPDWRFRLPRGGLSLWCELPPPTDAAVRAHSPRRPSDVVSWCHPDRCSPPRVASTPSSGSPSPDQRTSSATAVDRLADAWAAVSDAGRRGTRRYAAYPRDGRLTAERHGPQTRSTRAQRGRVDRACSISASASAGIAESTDSATRAWPPLAVAGDLHAGDVDRAVAEDPADGADHARAVRRR